MSFADLKSRALEQAEKLSLPMPTPEESEVSGRLYEHICHACGDARGIPFSRFMDLALYDPQLGYYRAGKNKFGTEGDFVTAPEMGSVFATCVANQCQQILQTMGQASILEAGAGRGKMAADILRTLYAQHSLPQHYYILELSNELRQIQFETIAEQAPELLNRVTWLERFPDSFEGIILANELLDALPVDVFAVTDSGVVSINVYCRDGILDYCEGPASEEIAKRINPLNLPPGYRSEINLHAEAWIRSAATTLSRGVILLVDYGFPRNEFYHPQRQQGSLMCHYRHHSHADPLSLIGLQDITAHIDFTAMAEAALESGLEVAGYASQAAFLMGCGLERIIGNSNPHDTRDHLSLTTEIKKLTQPSEMGELFKVIAFARKLDEPLMGFSIQDRRHRL